MTADFEGPGIGEIDRDHVAGRLFARIEVEAAGGDVDLVEKLVLVAELHGIARADVDLLHLKRAILLDDRMGLAGERYGRAPTGGRGGDGAENENVAETLHTGVFAPGRNAGVGRDDFLRRRWKRRVSFVTSHRLSIGCPRFFGDYRIESGNSSWIGVASANGGRRMNPSDATNAGRAAILLSQRGRAVMTRGWGMLARNRAPQAPVRFAAQPGHQIEGFSMSVNNIFVVSSVPTPANPARPKPPAPKCVTMLEAMPGFWRGRAFTRREMAKLFRQAGDLEAGNHHDREAKKYEAIANSGAVVALRRSVARVGA